MLSDNLENIWLLLNIALWIIIIFSYWKKEKFFSADILILFTYLGYSIVSYFYYNISYPEYSGIQLYPFLFQTMMILIALRPVSQYSNYHYEGIAQTNEKSVSLFLYVYAACSIITLIQCIPQLKSGLLLMLINVEEAGNDIYKETMLGASEIGDGTSILNMPQVFFNVFQDVGILLTFYYLTRPQYNKWFASVLIIGLLTPLFSSIAASQRGPAIDRLFAIVVTFFLFRPFFSEKIRKVARAGAIVLVSIIFIFMASITYSRFGQQNDSYLEEQLYSYIGMENLQFNKYAFDNNGLRYGDRTAPVFKRMLGFSNVPRNFEERRNKYPDLKTDDYSFIGFVGDFCLDYGPLVSFILFVTFSSLFCIKTKTPGKYIELHKLLLVQFAACVCMCGGMKLFSFADLGNLKIIALLIAYIYIKYTYLAQLSNNALSSDNVIETKSLEERL